MWKAPLTDWEKVDVKIYELTLAQSDKRLEDEINEENIITQRTYTLLAILIPIISLILGHLYKGGYTNKVDIFVGAVVFVFLVPLLHTFWRLFKLINTRTSYSKGQLPSNLLKNELCLNDQYVDNESLKAVLLRVIEQNEEKIALITTENKKRVYLFEECISTVFILFIAFTLCGMVLFILSLSERCHP